ncbi:MAG: penicillin-insensitive murein endopeptidase [Myxococcales bacterium]|nr:penicillin-insensitive murein endopeptidase [Myxococcales bacterium]
MAPTVLVADTRACGWIVRIEPLDGPSELRVIHGPTLRIGSDPACELRLLRPGIAACHCTIRDEGGALLRDHGAALGTLVNHRRCRAPTPVRPRDRILVGDVALQIRPLDRPPGTASLRRGFLPPRRRERASGGLRGSSDAADPARAHGRGRTARTQAWPRPLALGLACGLAAALLVALLGRAIAAGALAHPPPVGSPTSADTPAARGSEDPAKTEPEPGPRGSPTFGARDDDGASRAREAPSSSEASVRVRVGPGDRWASVADAHRTSIDALLAANPGIRRPLRVGDELRVPSHAAPASAPAPTHACELPSSAWTPPTDTRSVGAVNAGALVDPLRLPALDLYTLRCPATAHATAATAHALLAALACMRARSGYQGELVVGDLSRADGGPFGHHRSHQSGRDVDLWLPIAGGRYGRGCPRCGTDLCPPTAASIDWAIAWELVAALAERPEVEVIFLDHALQAELRRAALAAGEAPTRLDRLIQWPRVGAPALVQHSPGHQRHMHVRFRCGAGDEACVDRPASAP